MLGRAARVDCRGRLCPGPCAREWVCGGVRCGGHLRCVVRLRHRGPLCTVRLALGARRHAHGRGRRLAGGVGAVVGGAVPGAARVPPVPEP